MPKINPKTLSLSKAREDIQVINRELIKNYERTKVFEHSINTITVHTLKLITRKQAIKHALATKEARSTRSKIEIKRLLDL